MYPGDEIRVGLRSNSLLDPERFSDLRSPYIQLLVSLNQALQTNFIRFELLPMSIVADT